MGDLKKRKDPVDYMVDEKIIETPDSKEQISDEQAINLLREYMKKVYEEHLKEEDGKDMKKEIK